MIRPQIILGPPGTGKTTRLLSMVEEELASGTPPERIGYLSFTKKAATEAAERARKKFGLDKSRFKRFQTIHSLCFGALGLSRSDILDGRKALQEFGDHIGERITGSFTGDEGAYFGQEIGDRMMFMENLARVRCIPLRQQFDENDDNLSWLRIERFARGLNEWKRSKGLVDYSDMLDQFARQDWSPEIDVLFVDEAQDLSMLQWKVVHKLATRCRRLIIAGDDDQAIYRWAGAAVEYFIALEGDVEILGKSWRVPEEIQKLSGAVIAQVTNRRAKAWTPREGGGLIEFQTNFRNVDISDPSVLILSRNGYVLKDIVEPAMQSAGRIYERRGGLSIKQLTLDSIILWEKLRRGERITGAEARRVYQSLSTGTGVARGYKTLPRIADEDEVSMANLQYAGGLLRTDIWHDALERIAASERVYLLEALRKGQKLTSSPTTRLSTIHGAKGGEADHVVLFTDMASRTHREMFDNMEDELRVWYVAATRARKKLTIIRPTKNQCFTFPKW